MAGCGGCVCVPQGPGLWGGQAGSRAERAGPWGCSEEEQLSHVLGLGHERGRGCVQAQGVVLPARVRSGELCPCCGALAVRGWAGDTAGRDGWRLGRVRWPRQAPVSGKQPDQRPPSRGPSERPRRCWDEGRYPVLSVPAERRRSPRELSFPTKTLATLEPGAGTSWENLRLESISASVCPRWGSELRGLSLSFSWGLSTCQACPKGSTGASASCLPDEGRWPGGPGLPRDDPPRGGGLVL